MFSNLHRKIYYRYIWIWLRTRDYGLECHQDLWGVYTFRVGETSVVDSSFGTGFGATGDSWHRLVSPITHRFVAYLLLLMLQAWAEVRDARSRLARKIYSGTKLLDRYLENKKDELDAKYDR